MANDSLINQLELRQLRSANFTSNLVYMEPLQHSLNLSVNHYIQYSKEKLDVRFYNQDIATGQYQVYINEFSNGAEQSGWRNTTTATLTYSHKEVTISPGLSFFSMTLPTGLPKHHL